MEWAGVSMMQAWAPCRCGRDAGVGTMQAARRATLVGFPLSLQRPDYILGYWQSHGDLRKRTENS